MSNQIGVDHGKADFLQELPFQIVALTLGFQNLLRRLRRELGLRENVALGMGSLYFALLERDGCRMKDLGDRLLMPKGTLSGLIVRMEQLGWVARSSCPDDGRAWRIRLTVKARRREAVLRERHRRVLKILQAGLSAPEAVQLQSLLQKVLKNLRSHTPTSTPIRP